MKKIIPLLFLMIFSTLSAQSEKSNELQYGAGAVPVDEYGRISFKETIKVDGLTASEIESIVTSWFNNRFKEPTVIAAKRYESQSLNSLDAKAEEYIVFKKNFFVLDRSRISYFLTITSEDGICNFNMSRITYLYDEEGPEGGLQMKAEDWITDEAAINKKRGTLKKFPGKFRRETIKLKETLIKELKNELTK